MTPKVDTFKICLIVAFTCRKARVLGACFGRLAPKSISTNTRAPRRRSRRCTSNMRRDFRAKRWISSP